MRKIMIVFILISIITSSYNLYSQEVNFAPIGTKWTYSNWSFTCDNDISEITVERDTIIGSRYFTILEIYRNGNKIENSEIYIHEMDKKIYFLEENELHQLFDFSNTYNLGDTIEFNVPQNSGLYDVSSSQGDILFQNPIEVKVDSVGEVNINDNTVLKDYYVSTINQKDFTLENTISHRRLIENIGFLYGLLGRGCNQLNGGCQELFRCFETTNFQYNEVEECIITNVEVSQEKLDIKFFPNPVNEYLYIQNLTEDSQINIYNLGGTQILQSKSSPIDLKNVSSGIFLISVKREDQSFIQKIIKI